MADPSTAAGVRLIDARDTNVTVPLAGVAIDADVSTFCATVVVTHRYVNRESTPIEAVYVFPLDEKSAVCGFEAIVDGTLVIGEVQEREKAFELYDDAMEQGHGAFLLDEERPDVFQASVGNLPPGKEVLLKLTYVTELTIDGGRLRFTIPTTVSPRYAPARDHGGQGRPDAQALNPPVAWKVPYGLDLTVRLTMPGRISKVESPSHPITVSLDDAGATVTLGQQSAALDRDFVLAIDTPGLAAPLAVVERDDPGTEVMAVAFAPVFETTSAPAEVIFLVDRSGSMEGTSIEEVRNALQLCLRSMIPGCRLNIVGFGSSYTALFNETRAYDQASLDAASEHVATMRADLGGTEILPALEFVLAQPRHPELTRQLVVLTDGQVTNSDAVLTLAAKHVSDARIFTFGIGAGASHHLVNGLARAGGGSAEFIYPGERIEPKVVRQFGRLLSPALADVRVDWIGGEVTQAPVRVPPVFAGDRLLVYGFVKDVRPTHVRLRATGPSGPEEFEVPIDRATATSGRTVARLAARARIRELEEGVEWLSGRGSRQKERKSAAVTREIIALSIGFGIISRETSYVAIERRETPVVGEVQLRKIPVALTTGWGGLEQRMLVGMRMPDAAITLGAPVAQAPGTPAPRAYSGRMHRTSSTGAITGLRPFLPATPRRRHPQEAPPEMHALVRLQAADGSWDLSAEFAGIIGRELGELEAAVRDAAGAPEEVRRAWATALALVWLQRHAAQFEEEWRFLADKARGWLERVRVVPHGRSTWWDAARGFLSDLA